MDNDKITYFITGSFIRTCRYCKKTSAESGMSQTLLPGLFTMDMMCYEPERDGNKRYCPENVQFYNPWGWKEDMEKNRYIPAEWEVAAEQAYKDSDYNECKRIWMDAFYDGMKYQKNLISTEKE